MAWHPFRNLRLKVVALLLGFVLWFTVSGQQADLAVSGIPVVYFNTPQGLEITDRTNVVNIHVRGLENQLRAAMPRDFEARVDLSGARAGAQTFTLRTDQMKGPPGLEVTDIDPGVATVLLERAGTANLPVRPLVEGVPAAGFVVSQISVEPSTVTVLGPERRIASATAATTDRLSIDGARASVTQSLSVGVPDSALRLRESKTAKVVVTIEPAGERPFPALRVAVRNVSPGLRATVEPTVVSVVLRGALSLLARLEPASVVPYVDVTSLGRGRYEALPVLLDPGGTLTVASLRPATVIVTIN